MRSLLSTFSALLLSLSGFAADGARTQVRLLLSHDAARPGDSVTAAIQLRMPPRTHTYWRNPGESGQATEVEWSLPAGVTAERTQWPVPERFVFADIVTYGYHGEAVLLVPLKLSTDLKPGPLEITAKVSWQECEELCVLGRAQLKATLSVAAESRPSSAAPLIEGARQRLPTDGTVLGTTAIWDGAAVGGARPLVLEWNAKEKPESADFFPYAGEGFEVAATNTFFSLTAGKADLRLVVSKSGGDWPASLAGVLIQRLPGALSSTAHEVKVSIVATATATPLAHPRSLAVMLLFAFLGGLILNAMPCVLPVIALKILSFVSQSREAPRRVRLLGLVYGLGVLASFAVLAVLAIAVQKAGGLPSWGMLLQNQVFRVVMAVLITLVALNLFGVFEVTLGGRVLGTAGELASREGYAGAFFNGILATVLATPCTAPFLSAALAFAFTQPPWVNLLVFLTVGLGLAGPFVLLCWQPAWLKFMPKPGAWMERFKTAMGFPMLATAVWIFWFTASGYGDGGVLWLGLFLVVLAAAAWVWGEFVQRGTRRRGLAVTVSLILLGLGYGAILEGQLDWRTKPRQTIAGTLKESPDGIDWQPWSPEALAKARAEGRPVLVDFTAKNCLTCQLNKRSSLEVADTRAKLKAINAAALLGDFSDENPRIAEELRRFDRPGVPLVLVYPRKADAPPIVLPALLTKGIVLEALAEAGK